MTDGKYPEKILTNIKDYFEKERKHTLKRLKQLDEGDPFLDPDHANDNADIGTDVREELAHQQTVANREALQRKLKEIEAALERVREGSYGFCKKCGKLINTDRLSTNPFTVYCIDCAKK